ncbi:DUF6383 domain-containing protein [uncultured Parabacteroides sp.]|jgi:hypothetical protein|uniref:DUF6383 domain-containing protein n=1 Tax=uncultured Parabacteroides sp. TaxID=512312 RepID=UPI0025EEC8FF|nr:DUF6383 domain-containing protein [uncultured Parabacteroides sp.]
MNKKFSTLVAGVLLATSIGTVNAAPSYAKYATASTTYAKAIKAGTYYQLSTGTAGEVVAMVPVTGGTYKLQTVTTADAVDARYTLWTIDVQGNATDGYRYAFINLGTRSVLAVNPATALKALNASASATTVGGDVALWKWQDAYNPVSGFAKNGEKELTSVFGAKNDSIVTWVKGTNEVYALKYALNNPVTVTGQLKAVPVNPEAIVLGVDDLNSMLWANTEAGKLKLTFDKDVEGGNPAAINLFTKQEYKAVAPVGFPANFTAPATPGKDELTGNASLLAKYNELSNTEYAYLEAVVIEEFAKSIKALMPEATFTADHKAVWDTYQAIATAANAGNYNQKTAKTEIETIINNATVTGVDAAKVSAVKAVLNTILYSHPAVAYDITISGYTSASVGLARALEELDKIVKGTTLDGVSAVVATYTTAKTAAETALMAKTPVVYDEFKTAAMSDGWVSLKANDETADASKMTYLAVDTNFVTSQAGNKHLAFAIKNFKDQKIHNTLDRTRNDLNGRFNFQFVWHPSSDSIVIRTAGFAKKQEDTKYWTQMTSASNPQDLGIWKANAAALETTNGTAVDIDASHLPFEQNLIKIAVLADNHREVTVGSSEYKAGATPISTINTKITINGSSKYVRTTLPSGVYFFNLASNVKKVLNGKYLVASFCGSDLEYTTEEQAQLYGQAQDFGHMPRTQWVVEQNPGLAGEQTVNIYNREFPAQNVKNVQLYKGADASQIFAQYGIFTGVVGTDTLAWVKADVKKPVAGVLTNKYLGYNVVEQDDLSRKSFIMDYFNGIQIGHYVNVNKTTADTTVYVDLKGEKVTLELVPVQDKDQKFGYEGTAAPQLYNRAYAIRVYDSSKLVNDNKFIVEDPDNEASYAISPVEVKDAAHFYLKENNQLISEEGDTTCYYALVGGNTNAYNRVGVRDASQRFSIEGACSEERIATFALKESDTPLYRRLGVSNPEDGLKDMDVNKYAKIYRVNSTAKEYLYEDAYSVYSKEKGINFLGVEGKGDNKLSALYVDTAYVRNETKMPQYMFAVDVTEVPAGMLCPDNPEHNTDEYIANHGDCGHKVPSQGYKIGRYLVNAQDSVQLAANGKDYIWNEKYTRLSFTWAKHIGDTLIVMRHGKDMNLASYAVAADSIFLGDNKHNMATWTLDADPSKNTKGDSINAAHEYGIKNAVFALRLVDDKPACDFLIESVGDKPIPSDGKGGWIKIQNGVPVIAKAANYNEAILDTEIFNIEPTEEVATSNDAITAGEVSVVAGNGKVTIKGAAGKTVTISNILGQAIANTVLSSDNAEIAAPAGVVVVAVEGEAAVKAIVK